MNVLLLSMPDSFEHMPTIAIRMPNGALASLAGNVDPHHRVAIGSIGLQRRYETPAVQRGEAEQDGNQRQLHQQDDAVRGPDQRAKTFKLDGC